MPNQLRIRRLYFENFRGYKSGTFNFGDISFLVGPNGIGKTTILEAITLLCAAMNFDEDPAIHPAARGKISPLERMRSFMKKNIRNIDTDPDAKTFSVSGQFEYGEEKFEVKLNQDGWVQNDLRDQPFWWPGITFFAQFDNNMTNFQLADELWDEFAATWHAITGFHAINPERFIAQNSGARAELVTGFTIVKPDSKIHCRKGSAGEKKIIKVISQIVSMEEGRKPHIVLVDNLEMHIHPTRHLKIAEEVKRIFSGMQIVATTHSGPIIQNYQPRSHIVSIGGEVQNVYKEEMFEAFLAGSNIASQLAWDGNFKNDVVKTKFDFEKWFASRKKENE